MEKDIISYDIIIKKSYLFFITKCLLAKIID